MKLDLNLVPTITFFVGFKKLECEAGEPYCFDGDQFILCIFVR